MFLWVVFGIDYYTAIGIDPDEVMPPPLAPALIILCTAFLITSTVIALLVHGLGLNTWPQGIAIGLMVGVGLFATSIFFDSASWGDPFLPRRFNVELVLTQAGGRVTYPVLMGLILVLWQKGTS